MKQRKPKPLNKADFRQFGDVIEVTSADKPTLINQGFTEKFQGLAKIDTQQHQGMTQVSIFRSTPKENPIVVELMECHPLGSQCFIPLSSNPYLVIVAPPGDFYSSAIEVFLAQAQQGVNYHPGTWHHYSLALNAASDFLVIDRAGPGDNLREVQLPNAEQFSIDL